LSLTVLSNFVSGSSKFDMSLFYLTVPNFVFFLRYWIGNLIRILKMCFKQSFSYPKRDLQAILFLIVLSNCVSGSSNFDTSLFYLTVPNFVFFEVIG